MNHRAVDVKAPSSRPSDYFGEMYEGAVSNMLGAVKPRYFAEYEIDEIPISRQRIIADLNQLAKREVQLLEKLAAEKEKYYVLRKSRADGANQLYLDMLEEEDDGLYIQDIMRGGIRNDDPRIPRNLPK